MYKLIKCFVLTFAILMLNSCEKKELKTNLKTPSNKEIVVDKLSVSESDYGVGCVTEYYKKGSKMKDEIYLQTSSKDELTWVNYISINGKREVFFSRNDDTKSTENDNGYTLRLENDDYIIEIHAKIGEQNIESDSALANGTMTITRKSDKETTTINFEGGTAC
ncbi:hypothetical protein [Empedobacter sp. UBA7248]|uniref:hypothetical protein n=1 Tax=Empedobacter sp. UBA7248 TaxID=1946448 RepID=UPI0025BAD504|nr:hypothetical protein [Empedobacter sp. UBA7248]